MAIDDITTTNMTAVTKAVPKAALWIQEGAEMKCLAPEIHNYALFAQINTDGEWRLVRPKSCDNTVLTKLLGVLHDYAHKEGLVPARAWGKEIPVTVPTQPTPEMPPVNGPKLIRNTITIPGPSAIPIQRSGDIPV